MPCLRYDARMTDGILDARAVNELIRKKGLRKNWVAEQMGIHPQTLYAYLSGRQTPPAAILKLMALVLGVAEDDIKQAS